MGAWGRYALHFGYSSFCCTADSALARIERCKNSVLMMTGLRKHMQYIVVLLLALVLAGCGGGGMISSVDDLNGSHIAVLDKSVVDEDLKKIIPDSEVVHFKSASEFLLALAMGKCEAGVVEKEEGEYFLSKNPEYALLAYPESDDAKTVIIVHTRLLPGRSQPASGDNFLDSSIRRINHSLISDGYWKLILRGFAATLSIFLLGILMASLLTVLMLGMNSHKYLKYVSMPVNYFIKTIHDVPSIVLIFFFYYVVFASTHISGIIVCALSLGVYTSGSFIKVFTVHLKQIDKNQHAAAEMLGLTGWKKYRYVILPQAVKPMLPLLAAESKVLLRATTYAGYISELDLVKVTEIIRNQTYDVLVPLLLVSIIFLVLSHLIVEGLSAIYNKAFKYD